MTPHIATRGRLRLVPLLMLLFVSPAPGADAPTLEEVTASAQDLWGEAALRQPGGPSYEFFARLVPPLRYVDAPFRHYPIVLSAPGSTVKGRFISNGSAINELARQPNWRGETGVPVRFRVGRGGEAYGQDLQHLEGPKFLETYLPVVQLRYSHRGVVYEQEAFAATDPALAALGAVFVRFTVPQGASFAEGDARIQVQVEGPVPYTGARQGVLRNAQDQTVLAFDSRDKWEFYGAPNAIQTSLRPGQSVRLLVFTTPADASVKASVSDYDSQRQRCVETWKELLGRGMQVSVPEPLINTAWRATLAGNFMLLHGDDIRYSHGNQYAKLYIAEGGDAARSFLLWNYPAEVKRMIPPLFHYTRKNLEYHQGALKLQMLAHYYALTRDAEFVRSARVLSDKGRKPGWQTELDLLLDGREKESGLFPREQYAGDIPTPVYSANSNANGWRALRDMAVVFAETGDADLARRLDADQKAFRQKVMAAIEKSTRRDVSPPFVPVALFGEEQPYEMIPATRMGNYYNLMIPYVLGSGVFPYNSDHATAVIEYVRQRGGLIAGVTRVRSGEGWWVGNGPRMNDLYGLRYDLALLQRDEPDRAAMAMYGKLALTLTPDTFIGAEGQAVTPVDEFGRQFYLPPNSASNAHFLWVLRYLLVQDWDMNDDGRPETLRLAFATPRKWLEDGGEIKVERAPTAFGEVSFTLRPKLKEGSVTADVALPERARPEKTLLRLRLPAGWRIKSAAAEDGRDAALGQDGETVDLSGLRGNVRVVARVERPPRPQNGSAPEALAPVPGAGRAPAGRPR